MRDDVQGDLDRVGCTKGFRLEVIPCLILLQVTNLIVHVP